ncbi:DUF6286 domain-containing protein [Brachybacterium sp. AOP43-C2-M15]|uniref:DUF6286 domain-containing protein n=1 Tax=Brachybacterium sp. AOP43-C2-M15 TaxID=3457661 RepID=UPI00403335A7
MTTTPRRLDRRPSRSIPVGLLGAVVLTAGVLGAWLLGTLLVDGSWPASARSGLDTVGALRLDSAPVLAAAGVLALLGLLMLLAALLPGSSSRSRVLDGDVPGQTVVSRRDLARRVKLRVERVDGVHSARASVSRRRVDVVARTVVDDAESVLRAARTAAEQSVAELRPASTPRTRVRVQRMN